MDLFELFRPRTARAGARLRERELMKQLEKLLRAKDEETFLEGLEKDFGITKDHENFAEILKIWRDQQ